MYDTAIRSAKLVAWPYLKSTRASNVESQVGCRGGPGGARYGKYRRKGICRIGTKITFKSVRARCGRWQIEDAGEKFVDVDFPTYLTASDQTIMDWYGAYEGMRYLARQEREPAS